MAQATAPQSTRWQEIVGIWRDNRWLFVIAGWLLGILTFPLIQQVAGDAWDLLNNLVPEAVGIVFTVLILDRLNERRSFQEHIALLIRDLGSPDNGIARRAGRELWDIGSLHDGTLVNADLWEGNLANAQFYEVNLADANLSRTNLMNTNFREANLVGALFKQGIWEAKLDNQTVLPDGSNYDPKLGTVQLERFTNPNHPDFWKPKWIRQQQRYPFTLQKRKA